jgi:hypothetical protein
VSDGELTGRDTLNTTTTSETANGRLGDALDIVTKNLAMTLSATLAKTLSSFTTYRVMLVKKKNVATVR